MVVRRIAIATCLGLFAGVAALSCADLVGIPERFYSLDGGVLDGPRGADDRLFADDPVVMSDHATMGDQSSPGDDGASGGDSGSGRDGGPVPDGGPSGDGASGGDVATIDDGAGPPFPIGDGACPFCTDAGLCLLACNQDNPTSITLDTATVYWANEGNSANGFAGGAVLKADKSGANQTSLAMEAMARPDGVLVSGGCVYWDESLKGNIVSLCGSSRATPVTNLGGGVSFTVSGSTLVWATNGGGSDLMTKCTLPGCAATAKMIANNRFSPFGLAVDSANAALFWLESSGGSGGVYTCSLGACTPTPTSATPGPALSLAIAGAGSYVYTAGTASQTDGVIEFYSYVVGQVYLQASGRSSPTGIASDGTSICWAEPGSGSDGKVLCCDLSYGPTCTPKVLAMGLPLPTAVAIDATTAYWVNRGDPNAATGSVMSSPR